jgi:hypothetical protein
MVPKAPQQVVTGVKPIIEMKITAAASTLSSAFWMDLRVVIVFSLFSVLTWTARVSEIGCSEVMRTKAWKTPWCGHRACRALHDLFSETLWR